MSVSLSCCEAGESLSISITSFCWSGHLTSVVVVVVVEIVVTRAPLHLMSC